MKAVFVVQAAWLLTLAPAALAQETVQYSYDALGRLTTVDERRHGGNGALDRYEYDPASNRQRVRSSGQYRPSILANGVTLFRGQTVMSADTRFRLVFEYDGNLVLYDATNSTLWSSGTQGAGGTMLGMQGDGNLVMYDDTYYPIWGTHTENNPGSWLAVQDDGNVVMYTATTQPIWGTHTCCH